MSEYLSIDHPRFHRVERAIFTERVVADCLSHQCRLVKERDRVKLEACCQYGVDVDAFERDAILARQESIRARLRDEVQGLPWFEDDEQDDPDFPSGRFVRTRTHAGGCIFLAHDRRGCAIHRTAAEQGWDFHGVKPNVCRLFPLSYDSESIVLSDDYPDYSCAYDPSAPTVYRVGRSDLAQIFGEDLVVALDAAEARVFAEPDDSRVPLARLTSS